MRQRENAPATDWGASKTRLAASIRKPQNTQNKAYNQPHRIRVVRDGIEIVEARHSEHNHGMRRPGHPGSKWERSIRGEAARLGYQTSVVAKLWHSKNWELPVGEFERGQLLELADVFEMGARS
jgi:hypothetical protein